MKESDQPKPEIIHAGDKYIAGHKIRTCLAENKTQALWQGFAPKIKEIPNRIGTGTFSLQVYEHDFAKEAFTPNTFFEKWAGVEVSETRSMPNDFQILHIPSGRWAVFKYKGLARDFHVFARYIFESWLPQSGETLDARPHFEYIPPEYLSPENPEAEEYVWIPII